MAFFCLLLGIREGNFNAEGDLFEIKRSEVIRM
jgi:hypothetical protein